jgi:hypothetical protein
LLEVVDAVVLGLGDAKEGAVTEFRGEGDTVVGVGPGFEVGGEESAVALRVFVVVVVGEVAILHVDDGGAFGPVVGDGWTDVRPGAFDGWALGDLEMLFERGLALVFEDQMEGEVTVGLGGYEGGVDDAVAGVKEDL